MSSISLFNGLTDTVSDEDWMAFLEREEAAYGTTLIVPLLGSRSQESDKEIAQIKAAVSPTLSNQPSSFCSSSASIASAVSSPHVAQDKDNLLHQATTDEDWEAFLEREEAVYGTTLIVPLLGSRSQEPDKEIAQIKTAVSTTLSNQPNSFCSSSASLASAVSSPHVAQDKDNLLHQATTNAKLPTVYRKTPKKVKPRYNPTSVPAVITSTGSAQNPTSLPPAQPVSVVPALVVSVAVPSQNFTSLPATLPIPKFDDQQLNTLLNYAASLLNVAERTSDNLIKTQSWLNIVEQIKEIARAVTKTNQCRNCLGRLPKGKARKLTPKMVSDIDAYLTQRALTKDEAVSIRAAISSRLSPICSRCYRKKDDVEE